MFMKVWGWKKMMMEQEKMVCNYKNLLYDLKKDLSIKYIVEAHIIPIQYVGVQDCDKARISTNEILLYALANADDDKYGHEGGYAVIHSAQPVPDLPGASKSFDALAGAYPVLWPYG